MATSSHNMSKYGLSHCPFSTPLLRDHSLSPLTSAIILKVDVRLMCSLLGRVKSVPQFQLSESDPVLLMALNGLRDTEPLFFQRTRKEKQRDVSSAAETANAGV